MTAARFMASHASASPHRAVVLGGLIAGALDMVWVCTLWGTLGVTPKRIFQAVASGWLGNDAAVAGGWATALLGAVSHFAITIAMAYAYYLAARRLPTLARRPVLYGALYGIVLYVVMIHVVVPLSAAPSNQSAPWGWVLWANIAAHMLLVGVPCALGARMALRAR
ncbi:hypothetical protein [Pseudoxanthomonas putridarboris]|uniref:DUF1440 domain-containing protein n=1 Tax=Pseudoxanthomonas putridarboris TaxID=752605 RepID=A0ABU9IXF0_9GAMM